LDVSVECANESTRRSGRTACPNAVIANRINPDQVNRMERLSAMRSRIECSEGFWFLRRELVYNLLA
jgi:hypothetical protein